VSRRAGGPADGRSGKPRGTTTHQGRKPARPARGRESVAAKVERAAEVVARLKKAYPDAHCALDFTSPYQLIVATILSAQCTDVRVNMVTPAFFKKWPTPASLAGARTTDVEKVIMSTGFFRNKARNLIAMAQELVASYDGVVPHTMAQLHGLPGVGRKTANVVLGNAFGISEGVTVDTHVTRLCNLLRLASGTDAVKIEQQLMKLIVREDWAIFSHLLISHGRTICIANRPKCELCVVNELCPSALRPSEIGR